jgi:hypothetical protein
MDPCLNIYHINRLLFVVMFDPPPFITIGDWRSSFAWA